MYAIIDLGSNTVRMNIYRIKKNQLVLKNSHKETIGLAAYLEDGVLSHEGMSVAIKTVKKFLKEVQEDRIKKIYLIATATIRKAKNKDVFFDALKHYEKLDIHLLSGQAEATYDFHAVFLDAPEENGLVVDIGGGSTEIVLYKNNEILHADAIPIGSLSAYMDYVKKLIPSPRSRKKIKKKVFKHLRAYGFEPMTDSLIIHGVGGTMRAARKLLETDFDPLESKALSMAPLEDLIDFISSKEKQAYLKLIRTVPERIHTVGTGLVILQAIKEYFNTKEMRIFTQGVREGFMVKQLEIDFPELKPLGLKL